MTKIFKLAEEFKLKLQKQKSTKLTKMAWASNEYREAKKRGFKRPISAELTDGSNVVIDLEDPFNKPFEYIGGSDEPVTDLEFEIVPENEPRF